MDEQWKVVSGFPDYAVSDLGRVKRIVSDRKNHVCRVLAFWIGNHGYPTVGLSLNGAVHRRLIHRLVCEAFHGPAPSALHQVAHGDGIRTNVIAANLRWATRSQNMEDARAHGTMAIGSRHGRTRSPEKTPRGERHGHAKLTEADVQTIRFSERFNGSGRALAAFYGISPATISIIRSGKTWKHVERETT